MEEIWRFKDLLSRGLSWTLLKYPTLNVQVCISKEATAAAADN